MPSPIPGLPSIPDALNGNVTHFDWNNDGSNQYAFATQVTNALNQATTLRFDYSSGKLISVVDPNQSSSSYAYNDPLDRLTTAVNGLNAQTLYSYLTPTEVDVQTDQATSGDRALKTVSKYDGFGRSIETDSFEDSAHFIVTTTQYDPLGRTAVVTAPSRPGDGLNYATTYSYNSSAQSVQVTTADGAVATTTYQGNQVTVTDQAGNTRKSTTDSLGRLTAVVEDPAGLNYQTFYAYDVLGNLTCVNQGPLGANSQCDPAQPHARQFSYDSLSRLTTSTNPESGTVTYAYDGAGNVLTKTDNRGIVTCFGSLSGTNCRSGYDALNRPTLKSYSDGTAAVSYLYDDSAVPNAKGRLTQVRSADSTTAYTAYDPLGQVLASIQSTGGQNYSFAYTYNLAGALTSETYPSGRVITTCYDSANRTSQVSGSVNAPAVACGSSQRGSGQTIYVSGISYFPHGAVATAFYGNQLAAQNQFNPRLQPSQFRAALNNDPGQVLTQLNFDWGSGNNNGILRGVTQANGGPGYPQFLTFQQAFGYDAVNRLTSASDSGGWSRSFNYDEFGNLWVPNSSGIPAPGPTPSANVYQNNAHNQNPGFSYDAAGNQMVVNGNSLVYDAENHAKTVTEAPAFGGGSVTYGYDGAGQRVSKLLADGSQTVYVYDAFGHLVAEYSTAAAAASPCQTCYLSYDHLGSVRLVTDQNGNAVAGYQVTPLSETAAFIPLSTI